VILSFIGIEGLKARFHGVYQVLGHKEFTKADLKKLPEWLAVAQPKELPVVCGSHALNDLIASGCHPNRGFGKAEARH
jgi:hypothetical protein